MATSQVPRVQFTPEGLVLPQESEILAGVLADMDSAFGGGLNKNLETPQGQLASTTTAIIGDKNSEFASYVNQVDPAFAAGRMQDAIGRIYFLDRKPGTATTVIATCMGLTGVTIPVGARAQAVDGNIYLCTQAGTIPASGSIDLPFSCSVNGPINCAAGTLNQIYQAIPGWDSVLNADAGTVGSNVESRAEFEDRRRQSVAINARSSLQSIYAAVANLDGVIDVYVTENNLSIAQTIGGVSLVPHSIWVAVVGGEAADIAAAIWRKKSNGADYNGNTSYTVEDRDGYSYPYPSYLVKWETPAALPVKFAVQLANNPALPSNIVDLTKQAIIDAFNGADGGQRARIGATIYASRFYAPVSLLGASVSILSLLLGDSTPTAASLTVPINRRPTVSAADISVTLV
ncbi:baseplate J/gp47 family protein [Achromobacter xylosoxidans]|uniref:baseplate J/gp47 family protein n=1 Tax=Alcaligenes xylosoxydans xylosoxydans TaxID=85698 RepID=UPI001F0D45F1|nr:baseplate J/gp47 family protein [Achromobacter xylosoxidans]MCH4575006.1 baseplate J/gp47 family protein [Achromobacter xylosoxidans]